MLTYLLISRPYGCRQTFIRPYLNSICRARDLMRHGGMEALWGHNEIQLNDLPLTFDEITSHYLLSRRVYTLPHLKLDRPQLVTLGMLQACSFPSRGFLSRVSTEIHLSYPDCNEPYCSLAHMLWQCLMLHNCLLSNEAHCKEALQSSLLHAQLQAIQRAQERVKHHGVSALTWTWTAVSPGRR